MKEDPTNNIKIVSCVTSFNKIKLSWIVYLVASQIIQTEQFYRLRIVFMIYMLYYNENSKTS